MKMMKTFLLSALVAMIALLSSCEKMNVPELTDGAALATALEKAQWILVSDDYCTDVLIRVEGDSLVVSEMHGDNKREVTKAGKYGYSFDIPAMMMLLSADGRVDSCHVRIIDATTFSLSGQLGLFGKRDVVFTLFDGHCPNTHPDGLYVGEWWLMSPVMVEDEYILTLNNDGSFLIQMYSHLTLERKLISKGTYTRDSFDKPEVNAIGYRYTLTENNGEKHVLEQSSLERDLLTLTPVDDERIFSETTKFPYVDNGIYDFRRATEDGCPNHHQDIYYYDAEWLLESPDPFATMTILLSLNRHGEAHIYSYDIASKARTLIADGDVRLDYERAHGNEQPDYPYFDVFKLKFPDMDGHNIEYLFNNTIAYSLDKLELKPINASEVGYLFNESLLCSEGYYRFYILEDK